MRVIDGDGHVFEDSEGMQTYLPDEFRQGRAQSRWFPPLDHFHGAMTGQHPPGSFDRSVGPDGWLESMDEIGMEQAVLYTTGGLAFGKIFHYDWAIAVARAYNDWLHEAYLQRSPRFNGMALIPIQEPEAAVVELRRAVKELGFCGAASANGGHTIAPSVGLQKQLMATAAKDCYQVRFSPD